MTTTKPCKVCSSMEPVTVNRLLMLGRAPRWIANAGLGVDRRAVVRHRDQCLTENVRAGLKRDLCGMINPDRGEVVT